jgi:DNA-binding GntR family transcriptional regulator
MPRVRFARIVAPPTQRLARPPAAASVEPLVRVDLDEHAYASVRERLLARRFAPGERFALQGLADELGVSRSPVHQALTRLVSGGIVLSARRGYVVRPITPS